MNDNTLMIMATIENNNRILKNIAEILERIEEKINDLEYRSLQLVNYEEDDG